VNDRRSFVCRHLALVAVDGSSAEVADTLTPDFLLHIDTTTTDRWGYLALIDARWATEGPRPPLDVVGDRQRGDFVTVTVAPHCLAHFRVPGDRIAEVWMTPDWRVWAEPLAEMQVS
jgi:hypothetical protein